MTDNPGTRCLDDGEDQGFYQIPQKEKELVRGHTNWPRLNFTTPVEWKLTRTIIQKVTQEKKHVMCFVCLNMFRLYPLYWYGMTHWPTSYNMPMGCEWQSEGIKLSGRDSVFQKTEDSLKRSLNTMALSSQPHMLNYPNCFPQFIGPPTSKLFGWESFF